MFWSTLTGKLEQASGLDPAAKAVEGGVRRVLRKGAVADALHGTWLGHPVHPILIGLPIGFWSSALVLDLTGGDRTAARRLVAAGVLSVLPTAATGLADWSELGEFERPKRVGLVHAATNSLTTLVYAASWLARRRGDEARGTALALAGTLGLTVGGYLGGHLSYSQGVGVNRNADSPPTPTAWTDAMASDELSEGALKRVEVEGHDVFLTRRGGTVSAMEATCSHYGAPLEEGQVVVQGGEACVECPWHGSRFRLRDGGVARGPATSPQRSFMVRELDGRLQLRVRL